MADDKNTTRRAFTEAQRRAAYVAAGGVCEICGADLGADFHADHVFPFSAGGKTELSNIQATCPQCNRKKGAAIDRAGTIPCRNAKGPRRWQQKAFDAVMQLRKRTALIQATPGAGKTGLACGIARAMFDQGRVERVLVVSPLTTLQDDWADNLALFGIQVDPDSAGKVGESRDYVGRSLTYSALCQSGAGAERILQHRSRTLVIIDEIHHASDSASWGVGLKYACEHATFILCLSGTPFRTDGAPIPFVEYSASGESVADFVYSYAESISDNPQVCRPVYFPAYEGNLEWLDKDKIHQASFSDDLNQDQESKRLRTALTAEDWMVRQLTDANHRLIEIRSSHPDAGGLVVAMDQLHARLISEAMDKVCASRPVLVISDDREIAEQRLKEFRVGVDPWIIAVRKVSEGVDIPRLRVCVYMSNVITEMFFRQVVGRVVRHIDGIQNQEAFVYIPSDRRLIDMAIRMQQERAVGILQSDDDWDDDGNRTMSDLMGSAGFRGLDGSGWHEATISYNGNTFTHAEIESAKPLAVQYGVRPEIVAQMIRDGLIRTVNGHDSQSADAPESPLYQQHRELKKSRKRKELLSDIRWKFLGHVDDDRAAYSRINTGINAALGLPSKGAVKTLPERKAEMKLLEAAATSREAPSWLR